MATSSVNEHLAKHVRQVQVVAHTHGGRGIATRTADGHVHWLNLSQQEANDLVQKLITPLGTGGTKTEIL